MAVFICREKSWSIIESVAYVALKEHAHMAIDEGRLEDAIELIQEMQNVLNTGTLKT